MLQGPATLKYRITQFLFADLYLQIYKKLGGYAILSLNQEPDTFHIFYRTHKRPQHGFLPEIVQEPLPIMLDKVKKEYLIFFWEVCSIAAWRYGRGVMVKSVFIT
jgi:hypothetical protein